jgi:hypothetical protein
MMFLPEAKQCSCVGGVFYLLANRFLSLDPTGPIGLVDNFSEFVNFGVHPRALLAFCCCS